jgi:hypothetical protein
LSYPYQHLGRVMLYKYAGNPSHSDTYTPGESNRRPACRIFFRMTSNSADHPRSKSEGQPLGYDKLGNKCYTEAGQKIVIKSIPCSRKLTIRTVRSSQFHMPPWTGSGSGHSNQSLGLLTRVIGRTWGHCTSRLRGTLGSLVLVCNATGLLVDIEDLL